QLTDRFVPILREGNERPTFLKSKLFVDFRSDADFSTAMSSLVSALQGFAPAKRPTKTGEQMSATTHTDAAPRERAPVVVASLPTPPNASEYFGPVEIENASDFDAFNVDVGDISNGSQLARFSRIPRLRPRDRVEVMPVIDRADETRRGYPDLY